MARVHLKVQLIEVEVDGLGGRSVRVDGSGESHRAIGEDMVQQLPLEVKA